ncbi:ferritin-like domain-containing protein [Pseudoduganella chitinolytica]|uniref:Ferritin-like domain-containing protein n=1 Tax=Pseudoduganella chitinolytica TaxID=34070 RepID=A0ABY8BIN9_9BURK|nr:ferritin-like domain-containing protein [Pseudoduganella chitinolytica]WEF34234.1 ferritin-like domain-containing protein [Pseudoduganella chitinolytica]
MKFPDIQWTAMEAPGNGLQPAAACGIPRVANAASPREDAIGLLRLAAEIEHALMVQYLYAAQSLRDSDARTLSTVAVQEMGHLLTVQNLLLAIAGVNEHGYPAVIHFGRDTLRRASNLNPLPLTLESLSRTTLGNFVAIESPGKFDNPAVAERVETLRLKAGRLGYTTRPVHNLYAAIHWLFLADDEVQPVLADIGTCTPGWHLAEEDFVDPATIDRFAATQTEWHSIPGFIAMPVRNRAEALAAIDAITLQGEGVTGSEDSHFARYIRLLDRLEAGAVRVRPLARTPHLPGTVIPEDPSARPVTHPITVLWAELFNLQYECLLVLIAWSYSKPQGSPTRAKAIDFAVDLMNQVIQPLANDLSSRALDEQGPQKAGPPYGLRDETMPSDAASFAARFATLDRSERETLSRIKETLMQGDDPVARLRIDSIENYCQQRQQLLQEN